MTNDIKRCTYPACPEGSCCADPSRATLTNSEAIVKRAREIEEELRKALPPNTDFAAGWQRRYLDRQSERYEKALEMARAEAAAGVKEEGRG